MRNMLTPLVGCAHSLVRSSKAVDASGGMLDFHRHSRRGKRTSASANAAGFRVSQGWISVIQPATVVAPRPFAIAAALVPEFMPSKRAKQIGRLFNGLFVLSVVAIMVLPQISASTWAPEHAYVLNISRREVFVDGVTFLAFSALIGSTFAAGAAYGLILLSSRRP